MQTVVVPVDFSRVSLNAASYAVDLLASSYDSNLVLYHMCEKKAEEQGALEQLLKLQNEFSKNHPLRIESIALYGEHLVQEIERVVHHRHASLVVMGITGKTAMEKAFIGSNTLKLVDHNVAPVLIIPPDATFKGVKNVALTSDFKDVRTTTPSIPIKSVLKLFHPALHIVNVDSTHYVSITADYQKEKAVMQQMFSEYNPEFYFIGMSDFYEAIERFTQDKNIDLLITIPRQHSLLDRIFKGHHTKKLVYHSHVPILAVHE